MAAGTLELKTNKTTLLYLNYWRGMLALVAHIDTHVLFSHWYMDLPKRAPKHVQKIQLFWVESYCLGHATWTYVSPRTSVSGSKI